MASRQDRPKRTGIHPGCIVWGKLRGFPWWPAIVVRPYHVGMNACNAGQLCLFWFGDYRTSKVPKCNVEAFKKNFIERSQGEWKGTRKVAILDAIKEEAQRHGCTINDWSPDKLREWAEYEFPRASLENWKSSSRHIQITSVIRRKMKEFSKKCRKAKPASSKKDTTGGRKASKSSEKDTAGGRKASKSSEKDTAGGRKASKSSEKDTAGGRNASKSRERSRTRSEKVLQENHTIRDVEMKEITVLLVNPCGKLDLKALSSAGLRVGRSFRCHVFEDEDGLPLFYDSSFDEIVMEREFLEKIGPVDLLLGGTDESRAGIHSGVLATDEFHRIRRILKDLFPHHTLYWLWYHDQTDLREQRVFTDRFISDSFHHNSKSADAPIHCTGNIPLPESCSTLTDVIRHLPSLFKE